ncbi:MAG: sigma-54-dependent Fis family transcriptional regulator [Deltaproteobacteria bacterium]|nr:MAG: sigma-54-dependent Fis family transcriptional regulator [Deltaproteobacteria bacterium]TMQ06751.1 MAG: sigma-54-dependent Fis family transcriptional regulator [Deltaproteobacteria bacterium]
MTRPRVLVVDDKDTMVMLLSRILSSEFDVTTAADGTRALGLIASQLFDVVVSDIRMPGADGMAVLRETRRVQPDAEVILMTAFATVQAAVEAMKQGAYDYLQKPFEPDEALLLVRRAAERKQLRTQARDLEAALASAHRFQNLIAESPQMHKVLELVRRAATSDVTVLTTGESGVGKEVVARAVHSASNRAQQRFIAINCGAMPEQLFEAELFGYVKGAFTGGAADHRGLFEQASGGTLFLDEIGELPLAMQVKLNRVLQERTVRRVGDTTERPVDVRVIAATNIDLPVAIAAGRFREDLYYRINVFPIHVPPLRDRRSDVPLLAELFLQRHHKDGQPDGFTPDALALLMDYEWPGNVRELENLVQRALAVSDGPKLGAAAFEQLRPLSGPSLTDLRPETLTYRDMLEAARERATRDYLVAVMKDVGGNVTQAAERAGIERESMHRLLKKHGVRSDDFKPRGA